MEYPHNDQEFYSLIEVKRKEIASFDIDESEKERLYSLVNETITRYEDGKKYNIAESFGKLGDALVGLVKQVIDMKRGMDSLIPTLNIAKVNMQIANAKIKESNIVIRGMIDEQKSLDRRLTTAVILKRMREQKK